MPTVGDFSEFLRQLAPLELAEPWDNVGLLVGDPAEPVQRAMTCLTLSLDVAAEAIREQAQLVISHHPLPFRPLARLTVERPAARVLWRLIKHGISVYSAHTAFDSAQTGINQQLAEEIGLLDITPLLPRPANAIAEQPTPATGTGRLGRLSNPLTAAEWVQGIKRGLDLPQVQFAGDKAAVVERLAVACGSGGSLLREAIDAGCQALVTGDIGFHEALEAIADNVCVVAIGHFASERFAMERLAARLNMAFPECAVWPCRSERDPFEWC